MQIDPDDTLQVEMVPVSNRSTNLGPGNDRWRYTITKNGEPTDHTGVMYGRRECYDAGLAEIRRLRGGRLS